MIWVGPAQSHVSWEREARSRSERRWDFSSRAWRGGLCRRRGGVGRGCQRLPEAGKGKEVASTLGHPEGNPPPRHLRLEVGPVRLILDV